MLVMGGLGVVDATSESEHVGGGNGRWTLLQVLLPLAALTLLWGRQGFITRFFLLPFKENCISALCPSFDKHTRLLKWIEYRLKYTWASRLTPLEGKVADYWRRGTLLCLLVNSAIPQACYNPFNHWKERPSHGQHLAYKYLGVTPIFTDDKFKSEYLTAQMEYEFYKYLVEVQKVVEKMSQREIKYSSRYVARGMGLFTGEVFGPSIFYIYNYLKKENKSDVVVTITGPYGTHCSTTITPVRDKKQTELQRLAYVSKAQKLFFRSFSIDLGSGHKEKSSDNIPIKTVIEEDRTKVMFIPQTLGIHEITIVTDGYHLGGSPFLVNIMRRSSKLMESFGKGVQNYTRRSKAKSISGASNTQSSIAPEDETSSSFKTVEVTGNTVGVGTDHVSVDSAQGLCPLEFTNPKTSPICNNHIEHEVTTLSYGSGKEILQIDIDEESSAKINLGKRETDATTYVDSYLTELALQSTNNCTTLFRPKTRERQSLPNLSAVSTKYKERQKYWEKLSSQTPCSSISSGQNYSFNLCKYSAKTASLPNLSNLREEILAESNSRCDGFADFYGSCEAESFRSKFLLCRDYWEALSRQLTVDENDLDSGYHTSLSSDNQETKQSKQFREKRQFWENLSAEGHQSRSIFYSWKTSAKGMRNNQLTGRKNRPKSQQQINLTDDSKQISHRHYVHARNFFKSLEDLQA